jgi:hypothetical protein
MEDTSENLPTDFDPEPSSDGQSEEDSLLENRIYLYECTQKVYEVLCFVMSLMKDEALDENAFLRSLSWCFYQNAVLDLTPYVRRQMIERIPVQMWDMLPKCVEQNVDLIAKVYQDRFKKSVDFDPFLIDARVQCEEVLNREEVENADDMRSLVEGIRTLPAAAGADDKAVLLAGAAQYLYIASPKEFVDWIRKLDMHFADNESFRFLLWNALSSAIRLDPQTYPFHIRPYFPYAAEILSLDEVYAYNNLTALFMEFVFFEGSMAELDRLYSFFPQGFFDDVDRSIAWQQIEVLYEENDDTDAFRDHLAAFEKFSSLFISIEEDEEEAVELVFDFDLLEYVNEAVCIWKSERGLTEDI